MKKIRYGILSTAQIVPRFVQGIRESRQGEAAAIASRDLTKAKEAAEKLGIPKAYGSYDELCRDKEIDVVYIATYNKGHYSAARLALENHKHVLLEKPFTLCISEAEELFELAEKNNCFLMEAQKAVFLPVTAKVKAAVQENKIGKVLYIRSVTAYPNIDHLKWFHSMDAGGGALHGSGSYPLEYIQFILGEAIESCTGQASIEPGKTDARFDLSLKFSNQLLASIFITVNLDLPSEMTIYGEKGKIEIPSFWKAKQGMIHYADGTTEKLTSTFNNEFSFEVDHVNDCLEKGLLESPAMTKKITLDTVKLVEEMYTRWTE
ncbi:Gfo/Idh/MocA family oxidoreductase [Enterococcus sp. BWB1-3]|uniref:Gfo/Idh/MocA family protein n=1 Tax=unclassified Enterococcus TaxID=2608891 RepID=UPI001924F0FD|nr:MULTISPECIES: Gfo/Idh/MocA family oxidoreductase [unclassified Enterococcus]MBL1227677.1 Gfo/Idh/MocA family oxidoreductase [Enterococcus sp. BWB1-3]MCB5952136.1 Gfo/Idh/MocA family oxidoreductase [Enterococcus sp. BWT-B8]MCB5954457.1 Gfo/Idh/MocA family oxidoreductase [Enterococcus sp. CWB-B31]